MVAGSKMDVESEAFQQFREVFIVDSLTDYVAIIMNILCVLN